MKIIHTVTMASALLLAAGCAHEEHTVQTEETTVTPTYSYYSPETEYNTQNHSSSLSATSANSGSTGRIYSDSRTDSTVPGDAAPLPDRKSDNAIVAQVRETLLRDPEIAFVVPNLQITANNGAIILNGSVQSEEQRRQVLAKVRDIPGVVNVNNQLNVMAGPGNSSGLDPTSSSSGTDRLYKDAAAGPDSSTNSVLNPTSRENGSSQLYRQNNNQGESASDLNSSITATSQWEHSTNKTMLNPTSRTNGQSELYQNNPGEKPQDQNSNYNIQQTP